VPSLERENAGVLHGVWVRRAQFQLTFSSFSTTGDIFCFSVRKRKDGPFVSLTLPPLPTISLSTGPGKETMAAPQFSQHKCDFHGYPDRYPIYAFPDLIPRAYNFLERFELLFHCSSHPRRYVLLNKDPWRIVL
jgi:hypothetical protein